MDTDVTQDQPTVEQLLQRIRDKAQSRTGERPKGTFRGASSSLLQRSDFYSLREMKECASAAYACHNEVGRINPRNPGLHNNLLQFLKKSIQRALAWYTRPLHLFQAATARALVEVSRALEDAQQKQLNISEQIAQLESELYSEMNRLRSIIENMQSGGEETANTSHAADSCSESKAKSGQS